MQAIGYTRQNSGQAGNPLFHSVCASIIADMKTLDELRALPAGDKGCGVYFLWWGDELHYVGASRDLGQRLYWHHCAWKFKADSYRVIVPHNRNTVLACGADELKEIETRYLQAYRPPFNKDLR
jgi:hypothetical protein